MQKTFENLNLAALRSQSSVRFSDPSGAAGDIAHLSRALEQWIVNEGWNFSCQGIELSAEEMSAGDGLLPIVLLQAQECVAKATGAPLTEGVVHAESETGLCGVSVSRLRQMSIGQWLLYASFALGEQVKNFQLEGPVPVDEWYETWQKALDNRQVVIETAPTAPQPGATVRS